MIVTLLVLCLLALIGLNVQASLLIEAFRLVRSTLGHLSSDMDDLVESAHLLRVEADRSNAHLLDVGANIVLLRGTLESVIRVDETPTLAAIEAPQVPRPHGESSTLHLRNKDGTIAHEVTYHRTIPNTYAYGGRVFTLVGQHESGSWDFAPV